MPIPFPKVFRSCVCALAMVAALLAATPTTARATPTAQQVQGAKDRVDALIGEMKQAQSSLDGINRSLATATAEVDKQQAALEKINVQLATTQQELQATQDHYNAILQQLNERATEAFMDGGASNLGFILGATSIGDLSDRLEFVTAVAQNDAALAQEVANARNRVQADLSTLVGLRAKQRDAFAHASEARAQIDAAFKAQQQVVEFIATKKAAAEKIARRLSHAYQAWLSRQTFGGYGGGHSGVPMPPGWDKVLLRCPVDGPRSFTDGFGEPRYTGGFHLHQGVDVMAPRGTPIVAPFDGTAQQSASSLGGNEVYVYGAYGYVFNAHLSSYTSQSNGQVHTGDVIGYVGDTGDAVGTHDHFEFHPNVIPSNWPASPFGYAVIGSAIDPYPLLVAACG
jgi:murein DD-endopeptidase MepM/ murein hydrolase activator NlpD